MSATQRRQLFGVSAQAMVVTAAVFFNVFVFSTRSAYAGTDCCAAACVCGTACACSCNLCAGSRTVCHCSG